MSAKPSEKIKNEKRPGKKTGRRRAGGPGFGARTYGKNNKSAGNVYYTSSRFHFSSVYPRPPPLHPVIGTDALGSQIYLADHPPLLPLRFCHLATAADDDGRGVKLRNASPK